MEHVNMRKSLNYMGVVFTYVDKELWSSAPFDVAVCYYVGIFRRIGANDE